MMDTTTSRAEFDKWWNAPDQSELRQSCAMGWGMAIWQASRESLVVERISSADVPSDIVYQLGGSGLSHDEAICEGYSAGFNAALRSAGLTVKG